MKFLIIIFFIGLIFIPNMFSQSGQVLITDRPDKTESASVVPPGTFQIETGFAYTSDKSNSNVELNSLNFASTLFRYGLIKNVELRLGGSFLFQEYKTDEFSIEEDGLSDLMIGSKYEFINDHHSIPDIALMLHFFVPAGAKAFKPANTEPQVIFSLSKAIFENLDIGMNLGSQYSSEVKDLFYFYSIAAGFGISEKFGSFIEISSEVFPESSPLVMAGAGFTYLFLPNLQLDISGGSGLFNNLKVWFLGAGISTRLPY